VHRLRIESLRQLCDKNRWGSFALVGTHESVEPQAVVEIGAEQVQLVRDEGERSSLNLGTPLQIMEEDLRAATESRNRFELRDAHGHRYLRLSEKAETPRFG
jgi:hypothetical protein